MGQVNCVSVGVYTRTRAYLWLPHSPQAHDWTLPVYDIYQMREKGAVNKPGDGQGDIEETIEAVMIKVRPRSTCRWKGGSCPQALGVV